MNARKEGRALVITKAHKRYVADVVIEDRLVHCANVYERIGSYDDISHFRADDRVWISSELREIRWIAERSAA
jgi:hypothetical protein